MKFMQTLVCSNILYFQFFFSSTYELSNNLAIVKISVSFMNSLDNNTQILPPQDLVRNS